MDLPSLRRKNLRFYCDENCQGNEAELARRIKRAQSQVHDMLAGNKAFGEKIARAIEEKLGLSHGLLDEIQGEVTAMSGHMGGNTESPLTPRQKALLGLFDGLTDNQQTELLRSAEEKKLRNDEILEELLSKRRKMA